MNRRHQQRLVVKIGSQVLCEPGGDLDVPALAQVVAQLAELHGQGWEVLLVSSGAVAAGSGLAARLGAGVNNPVTRRQVLAAAGQVRLMETYHRHFDDHGLTVAQILASKSDFQSRHHYLNMRGCLEGVLASGMIPVANENDVVSITELMFTDNDELAGLLAGMVNADHLCMLTAVPGVYLGEEIIEEWDEELHAVADVVREGTSSFGRGGMHSKLEVARKAARLGATVTIADGRAAGVLTRIAAGEAVGTRFPPTGSPSPAKRWLASMDDHALGAVWVNAGAESALTDPRHLASLLPVGVDRVEGEFRRGDVIQIRNADGKVLGCGRAQYDYREACQVQGKRGHKPLIHYDYLYLAE